MSIQASRDIPSAGAQVCRRADRHVYRHALAHGLYTKCSKPLDGAVILTVTVQLAMPI